MALILFESSPMNILFISYWGLTEGLTQATVLPNLRILAGFAEVMKIIFVTIEREQNAQFEPHGIPKVAHIPFRSKPRRFHLDKVHDFIRFPARIVRIIGEQGIDKMICRGAPAGALGYLAWRKTGVPFYVESFEPHSAYMLESGVWSRFDIRYWLQKYWERQQKRHAAALITVSNHYLEKLHAEKVPETRLACTPCAVDTVAFSFNLDSRRKIREMLGLGEKDVVGIYVGKFGGIYYDREAFEVFTEASRYWGDHFFLIILTPENSDAVRQRLFIAGYPNEKCEIRSVAHTEVPYWLSAADFAFSTIKPAPSRKYCSPVKNGEYWANGLPVLSTPEIGDDSEIIDKERAGAVFTTDEHDLKNSFKKVELILKEAYHRSRINAIAAKYRSFDRVKNVYVSFFYDRRIL